MLASVKAILSRKVAPSRDEYQYVDKEMVVHKADPNLSKRKMKKTLNHQIKEHLLKIDRRWIMLINVLDGIFMAAMLFGSIYLYNECADVRSHSLMTFLISSAFAVGCLFFINVVLSLSSFVCNRSGGSVARWHKKYKTDLLLCTGGFGVGLVFVNMMYAYMLFRFRPYLFDYLDSIYNVSNSTAADLGGADNPYYGLYVDDNYIEGPVTTCLSPSDIDYIETHFNFLIYTLIFIGFLQIFRYMLGWKFQEATHINPFVVPKKVTHPDYQEVIDVLDSVVFAIEEVDRLENEAEQARIQAILDEEARVQREIEENAWKVRMAAEAEDRRLKLEEKARRKRIRRMNKMPASALGSRYGLAWEPANPAHLGDYRAVLSNQPPPDLEQLQDSPAVNTWNHPYKRKDKLKIKGFNLRKRVGGARIGPTEAEEEEEPQAYDFDEATNCSLNLVPERNRYSKKRKKFKPAKRLITFGEGPSEAAEAGARARGDSAETTEGADATPGSDHAWSCGSEGVLSSAVDDDDDEEEEEDDEEEDDYDDEEDEEEEEELARERERAQLKLMKFSTKVSVKALWNTHDHERGHGKGLGGGDDSTGGDSSHARSSKFTANTNRVRKLTADISDESGAEGDSMGEEDEDSTLGGGEQTYIACDGEVGGAEEEADIAEMLHDSIAVDHDGNLCLHDKPIKHKPTPLITMAHSLFRPRTVSVRGGGFNVGGTKEEEEDRAAPKPESPSKTHVLSPLAMKVKKQKKYSKSNMAAYYSMLNQVDDSVCIHTNKPTKFRITMDYIIDELLDSIDYSTDNNTPEYRQTYFDLLNSRIKVAHVKPQYSKRKLILQPLNVADLHKQLGVNQQPDKSHIY